MTECVVICAQCLDTRCNQPRRWRHLCEDCATTQLEQHRTDTGHTDLELRVVSNATESRWRAGTPGWPLTSGNTAEARRAYRVAKRLGLTT